MKTITKLYMMFMVLILTIGMTYAAGSSTGGSSSSGSSGSSGGSMSSGSSNSGGSSSGSITSSSSQTQNTTDCESYSTVFDRVKCRLQYGESATSIPEPCRGLDNEQTCAQLYKDVTPCYTLAGTSKDQCLKQQAGFTTSTLAGDSTNTPAIRNYVLFLLYDLQDRVENAYNNGQITADQAADVINNIVTAKYTVTRNESTDSIRSSVAIVKQNYNEVMPQ